MCTVDKLLIKGIRSFSPDNKDVIEFYKPLTLIVGHNGAGKTTVIECLKQACTGDLPPNTRSGQSFIHDPKVAGETEVKAQIKLRFRTSTGQPVVVQRSFQLTQKKTKLEFKSLDSVLQTLNKETGEKQALTYRCADIDRIVPSLMGVSKAVLENVVFVHQEDSNWPLAEGKVLKEKFDDIFAATKYTKALKEVRVIQKAKAVDLKVMDKELAHLKTHKDNASKLKMELEDAKERSKKYAVEIEQLQILIKVKQEAQLPYEDKLNQIDSLSRRVTALKGELKSKSQETATRFAELKDGDYEETTEELEHYLKRFDQEVKEAEDGRVGKEQAIERKKAEEQQCTASHTKEVERRGRLQAAADTHAANILERDQFVLKSAADLGLALPAGSVAGHIPKSVTDAFQKAVDENVSNWERQLAQLKENHMTEDKALSDAVQGKAAELDRVKQRIKMNDNAITANSAESQQVANMICSINMTDQMVDEIKQREVDAKQKLGTRQREVAGLKLTQKIAEEQAEIDKLAAQISALRGERTQVADSDRLATQLRDKREDMLLREERIETQLKSKKQSLCSTLGVQTLPDMGSLREVMHQTITRRTTALNTALEHLRSLQSKQSQVQGEKKNVESQLRQQEARLEAVAKELKQGMLTLLGPDHTEDQFMQSCEETQKQRENVFDATSAGNSMFMVLNTFKHDVMAGACPICHRAFKGNEKQACLDFIASELQGIPQQIEEKQKELQELQQKLEGLTRLQPTWHRWSEIKNNLPPLRERMNTLTQDLQALTSQVESQEQEKAVVDAELQGARNWLQDVVLPLHNQYEELKKVKSQVRQLEAQVRDTSGGRTVADIDNELDEVENGKRRREREKDELQKRESKLKDELQQLNNMVMKLGAEFLSASGKMQRKYDLQARLDNLEKSTATLTKEISTLSAQKEPLAAEYDNLLQQQEDARLHAACEQSEMEVKYREACQRSDQWKQRNRRIKEYEAQGVASQLAQCNERVQSLEARREGITADLDTLGKELEKIKDRLAETDKERLELQAVVYWRRAKAEEEELQQQLQNTLSQIQEVGNVADLRKGLTDLEDDKAKLVTKNDELRGSKRIMDEEIISRQRELATNSDYRNIEQRYRKKNVEFKTTTMANSDLDKYHKALEKALLTFHTNKMADINKIIKELWQKTYQGQDIDYIQIKADADAQRSYNYRVVMYFGGAELEMRGRCSAGQKVLASLIIRLALAETFCLNCGILALDEPTTNLDADNSAGLAEALRNIIAARQDQENFQLLVITHDERFANMIGTREYAENLWRITKDTNHHTHVACESIME